MILREASRKLSSMKDFLLFTRKWVIRIAVIFLFFWIFIANWEFIFKKRVIGEVVAVERIGTMAIVTDSKAPMNPQIFSFSVAIKSRETSEIMMASSEDRQWAAVEKGNCVVAAYFPYPPWKFATKGSTEHNAQLLRNFTSCDQIPDFSGFWDKFKFFFLAI